MCSNCSTAYLEVGLVEGGREVPLRDGHADGIGDTLAKGPRGYLDTGGDEVFRVSWGLRIQLPKLLEVVKRDVVPGGVT